MRLGISYLFTMIRPMEETLVEKRLQPKYSNVDFIDVLCSKMPKIIGRDVLDVSNLVVSLIE